MLHQELSIEANYVIAQNSILTDYDRTVLTRLYQPLMGSGALALFLTLWADYEGSLRLPTKILGTHQRLLSQLQCTLPEFTLFRQRLEGIGLLKTYYESAEVATYTYVLHAPLTPHGFFTHAALSTMLLSTLGTVEFERTRTFFVTSKVILPNQTNITASFNEVYKNPLNPSRQEQKLLSQTVPLEHVEAGRPPFTFRFDILEKALKDDQIPLFLLTPEVRQKIEELSALYEISAHDMRAVITASRNTQGTIQLDKLAIQARKMASNNVPRGAPVQVQTNPTVLSGSSLLKEKVDLLNRLTPIEFLRLKNEGITPSQSEVDLILSVQNQLGLPNPVMNAIIDFTLLRTNNSLPRAYVEKVAFSVKRSKLTDGYQTMDFLINSIYSSAKGTVKPSTKAAETPIATDKYTKDIIDMSETEMETYLQQWRVKQK